MTIDNEKVRFEGFKDNLICTNTLGMISCYYALYTIEIEFKDNRYKFTPVNLEYRVPASQYYAGGMVSINFGDGSAYYNNKGKLRKSQETFPSSIEGLFNELNADLEKYLLLDKEDNNTDVW